MKKFSLLVLPMVFGIFFLVEKIHAQVTIVPSPYLDQNIHVPITDLCFGEHQIKSDSNHTYLLIDTCNMEFMMTPGGNFVPQSLRKIQLFINGELRMMQMFLPQGAVWQFYPMQYLGFPQGEQDSALFTFVAEIPDTTNFFPHTLGEFIRTKLTCRYHFSDNSFESFGTNTATGQTIIISSVTSGIEEIVNRSVSVRGGEGKMFVYENPLWIFDGSGRMILVAEEPGIYLLTPGYYLWGRKVGDKIIYGSLVIR